MSIDNAWARQNCGMYSISGNSITVDRFALSQLIRERDLLRHAVVKYGNRARMSNAADPKVQYAIDQAFESENETKP